MIRLHTLCSLIIFFSCIIISCGKKQKTAGIKIIWENQKAIAIAIPTELLPELKAEYGAKTPEIRLAGQNETTAILGSFSEENNALVFTPLIPFTRGFRYNIFLGKNQIGDFTIQAASATTAPKLTAIYPSADTIPENLLKIYLHFSSPMREGESGKYVTLIKNDSDTVKDAFLDLQPELWNPDRTVLTLWLDPGRIKRDLQPNKRLGAPLDKRGNYRIVVSKDWKDTQGTPLSNSFVKKFVTSNRDSLSPDPNRWEIISPEKNTTSPLHIRFGEILDHSLLEETMVVTDVYGKSVAGEWEIFDHERQIRFTPQKVWVSGKHKLVVESRLEDPAGNNLKRPFDRDVTKNSEQKISGDTVNLPFTISN